LLYEAPADQQVTAVVFEIIYVTSNPIIVIFFM